MQKGAEATPEMDAPFCRKDARGSLAQSLIWGWKVDSMAVLHVKREKLVGFAGRRERM